VLGALYGLYEYKRRRKASKAVRPKVQPRRRTA
jgi:hypothetical protein